MSAPETSPASRETLTDQMCHNNVSHMKSVTIRELKHETSKVLAWVESGEPVEIRRRNVPIAVLQPAAKQAAVEWPDIEARLRSIYGDLVLSTTNAEIVSQGRGER
jgi:prevent-host-death family protein